MPKYYEINEDLAQRAHEMMSFREYPEGRLTREYKHYVDEAYNLADEAVKARPEESDRIYSIVDRYAKKLADNLNARSRIGSMCPSVMVSGAGNFPVAKKRKQNAASDKNYQEFKELQKITDKIKAIINGKDIIKSGDPNAVEKLEKKVAALEERQEFMKRVNQYYRKHKTLEGCPGLSKEQIEDINEQMKKSWHIEDRPFMRYEISNNGQNLRKNKERLEKLKDEKRKDPKEFETEFFTVKENTEIMRLQLLFDDKPDSDVRAILKKNGFRWSPRNNAWQRNLTSNAMHALKIVIGELEKLRETGE